MLEIVAQHASTFDPANPAAALEKCNADDMVVLGIKVNLEAVGVALNGKKE